MTRTGSPAAVAAAASSTSSHTTASDDARPIGERKPHVVRSGPRPADLALANEQHLVDGAAVSQVADVASRGGRTDELHVRRVVAPTLLPDRPSAASRPRGQGRCVAPRCAVRRAPVRATFGYMARSIRELAVTVVNMSQQQPIRVVVEKKGGCLSGCGTALAVMLLLGLTIQYWYVALPIVAIVASRRSATPRRSARRRRTSQGPGIRG